MIKKQANSFKDGSNQLLLGLALFLIGVIFIVDLHVPSTIAIGVLYSIVILYSWVLPGRSTCAHIALLCTVLIVIAAVNSPKPYAEARLYGINVIFSLLTLWICTSLALIAKYSGARLEEFSSSLEAKISERTEQLLKSQNQVLSSERRYRNVLESAPDAMILVDEKGLIQMVNTQVENLFGYTQHELLGYRIERLVPERIRKHHPEFREGYFSKPRLRPMGDSSHLTGLKKNGEEFPVEISLSPLETESGMQVCAAIRDITERKKAEDVLREFNMDLITKNKELEQFAYIASHDLQEPLRTINSFVAVLARKYQGQLDQEADKQIAFITSAANRMSELITGLLEYSRLGKNKHLETCDSNVLLQQVLDDMQDRIETTKAHIEKEGLPTLSVYPTEFRALLANLISNAIKYKKSDTIPHISISAKTEGNQWHFRITDNGIGIGAEHLERIFVIFQRVQARKDYGGTGIGLAHCRKIISLHGGKIWAESEEGVGSTFHFTLPFARNKP